MILGSSANWPSIRLREVVRQRPSKEQNLALQTAAQVSFLPMEAIGEQGGLDLSIIRDKESVASGYTLFFEDDVLVAKITPCFENGKGAVAKGLLNKVGYGTTELHILSPTPRILSRFLYYVTVTHAFRQSGEAHMTGAAGQKRVPTDFVLNYRIGLPTLPEQSAIVTYLDSEIPKIDALISAKIRLMTLLTEKRHALVAHAVTRGICDNVPLRDSGVKWLGSIPEGWTVQRAKWLFRERNDRSTTGEETLLSLRMELGLIPHNEVSEKHIGS